MSFENYELSHYYKSKNGTIKKSTVSKKDLKLAKLIREKLPKDVLEYVVLYFCGFREYYLIKCAMNEFNYKVTWGIIYNYDKIKRKCVNMKKKFKKTKKLIIEVKELRYRNKSLHDEIEEQINLEYENNKKISSIEPMKKYIKTLEIINRNLKSEIQEAKESKDLFKELITANDRKDNIIEKMKNENKLLRNHVKKLEKKIEIFVDSN
jgi:hypothetical protein